jgi:sugar/nucleoside kinase (ribokinase family)
MKYDVITIGDASEDVFIRPSEMKVGVNRSLLGGRSISFELGEKIPIEDVSYEIGGSACNLAVGFARLGLKTSIFATVGEDSPADKIIGTLSEEGVDTSEIVSNPKIKTNFSVIINTEDGERTILVYHGLKDFRELKVKKTISAKWYFLAPLGEHSGKVEDDLISLMVKNNAHLAWNPGAIQIKEGISAHRAMLKNTTAIFLNREEAIKFIDYPVRPKDEEVMQKIYSFGPKIVVITNGKEGVKVYDGERFYHEDIIKDVKRIDATGAGDSFAAGFLGSLILDDFIGSNNQEQIEKALKYGIVNSTSVVRYVGAQRGLLDSGSIETEISKHARLKVEKY